ncbi:unnamed protein product [Amoebophrya sp. A25]|nr:unnamed protein product [Amoebophrya sp. A25]|eukprot:GSA25T00014273001.1
MFRGGCRAKFSGSLAATTGGAGASHSHRGPHNENAEEKISTSDSRPAQSCRLRRRRAWFRNRLTSSLNDHGDSRSGGMGVDTSSRSKQGYRSRYFLQHPFSTSSSCVGKNPRLVHAEVATPLRRPSTTHSKTSGDKNGVALDKSLVDSGSFSTSFLSHSESAWSFNHQHRRIFTTSIGANDGSWPSGSTRIHVATNDANTPSEDTYSVAQMAPFLLASVFDGHGGAQTAYYAAEAVSQNFRQGLLDFDGHGKSSSSSSSSTNRSKAKRPDDVACILVNAYRKTESQLWAACEPAARLGFASVCRVGSCAVSAVLCPESAALVVANAGDCRCFLGRARSRRRDAGSGKNGSKARGQDDQGHGRWRFVPSSALHTDYNNLMQNTVDGANDGGRWESSRLVSDDGALEGITLSSLHNVNDPFAREIMRRDFPNDPQVVQCIQGWQDTLTGRFFRAKPDLERLRLMHSLSTGARASSSSGESTSATSSSSVERSPSNAAGSSASTDSSGSNSTMNPHDDNRFVPAEFSCYVKGCLQPTRGFGDFYLKEPTASWDHLTGQPFFSSPRLLPYVTAEPDVRIYEGLSPGAGDKFIVLASDGLWDFLSEQEVLDTLSPYFANEGDGDAGKSASQKNLLGGVNLSQLLIDKILEKVARESSLESVAQLRSVAPVARRRLFDDSAILVIVL